MRKGIQKRHGCRWSHEILPMSKTRRNRGFLLLLAHERSNKPTAVTISYLSDLLQVFYSGFIFYEIHKKVLSSLVIEYFHQVGNKNWVVRVRKCNSPLNGVVRGEPMTRFLQFPLLEEI